LHDKYRSAKREASVISDEKIFDYFASRATQTANDTGWGLKLFLPIYSAILGGSIWLSIQLTETIPPSYKYVSDTLMILLTLVCVCADLDNLRAWYISRRSLAQMTAHSDCPIPSPGKVFLTIDVLLCLGMLVACGMFVCFNPFSFPLHHSVNSPEYGFE
jgi:hypothetical protein